MKTKKYQTIQEFMRRPFENFDSMDKDTKYEALYKNYVSQNKIRIEGFVNIENSYYVHIKIPSESQTTDKNKKYEYDVVIRFFTDKPELLLAGSFRAYYMQFFSNSPSFIYKYAYVYKQHDYLIEALYNKLDPEFKDVAPEKTNSNMEVSYDKSIYFACKFLSDHQFRYMNKHGVLRMKKKTPEKFFRDISDFKSVKFDQDIMAAEKKLKGSIEKGDLKDRSEAGLELYDLNKQKGIEAKKKKTINKKPKITAGHRVTKIVGRKTTRKG